MNYLSIDLGNKRCGLAYSNMGIVFTLPQVDRVKIIPEIKKVILQKEISKIIIGLPYDLYGKDFTQFDRTKKFISKLKEIFPNNEIIEVDERFTTFEALDTLSMLGEKNVSDKKDSLAAYFILERYLSKNK